MLPGVCRLQEILPLATQILHFKPRFPRLEILLQILSLLLCKLFSRLTVLQSGRQGQRGEQWDARLLNTASIAELIARGSMDAYTRGPTLTTLEIHMTSFDKLSPVTALSNVHCYVVLLVQNDQFSQFWGFFFNGHVVGTGGVRTMCASLSRFSMIVSC